MAEGRVERRLAAILAADVTGYSPLVGADEVGTVRALKALRGELVEPAIAEHRGRIVKTTGDGMLVEFASVVDAIAGLQQGMALRNADRPPDRRIEFRIGINLGDVTWTGTTSMAMVSMSPARLENLAEPGGICVSGAMREQLRDKIVGIPGLERARPR